MRACVRAPSCFLVSNAMARRKYFDWMQRLHRMKDFKGSMLNAVSNMSRRKTGRHCAARERSIKKTWTLVANKK